MRCGSPSSTGQPETTTWSGAFGRSSPQRERRRPASAASRSPLTIEDALRTFRSLFPVTRERTYLYSGGVTPAADPVRLAVSEWIENWTHDPIRTYYDFDELMMRLRQRIAALVGATSETVAITDNASRAANLAVRGLTSRAGTNVVADQGTYPSSLYPWLAMTGKEVHRVRWRQPGRATADVIERIQPDTTAVTVSHVDHRSGQRHDLRALADAVHTVGGVLVVDAAQSAGVVPIDVGGDGIDILIGTTRKWLLGLAGVGFLYARPGLLSQPDEIGHLSFDPASEHAEPRLPAFWPDSRRFDLGVPSLPGVVAARVGIDVLLETDVASITAHVSDLVLRCIRGLLELGLSVSTPLDGTARAGIVVVRHQQAEAMKAFLRERRVDVGYLAPEILRIDAHGFNTRAEVEVVLECLRAFLRRPSASLRVRSD